MFNLAESKKVILSDVSKDTAMDAVHARGKCAGTLPLDGARFHGTGEVDQGGAIYRVTKAGFSKLCTSLGIPARFALNYSDIDPSRAADTLQRLALEKRGKGFRFAIDEDRIEGLVSGSYTRIANETVAYKLLSDYGGDVRKLHYDGVQMRLSMTFGEPVEVLNMDPLFSGVEIFNAENGLRAIIADGAIWRQICTNGMKVRVIGKRNRAIHRGNSFFSRVGDMVSDAVRAAKESLPLVRSAVETPLTSDVFEPKQRAINKEFGEDVEASIIRRIPDEYNARHGMHGPKVYDLWNSVTAEARETRDINRARALEAFAHDTILN